MGNILKPGLPPTDNFRAVQAGSSNDVFVALYDYPPQEVSRPIFRLGEKLQLISEEDGWMRVISLRSREENYIPRKCVCKVYHGWLFEGISREKAEQLLKLPENNVGSFLIRESDSHRGSYSLAVRHRQVKHYRISRLPNNWYYISPRLTFQCLEDLVTHYSESADGICCVISTPCLSQGSSNSITPKQPNMKRSSNFQWNKVNSSELVNENREKTPDDSSQLSFGLRHSIASYLSLSEGNSRSRNETRKKKAHSVYTTTIPEEEFI
ncbi:src-like-adapter [Protopterus annectens]|uniref:src-like-adapter n=1 Tax=Protopterus annectens TaxID=7888 RepID=UPI001CFB1A61|nr:src-like-adapter [Protopterus annectens]